MISKKHLDGLYNLKQELDSVWEKVKEIEEYIEDTCDVELAVNNVRNYLYGNFLEEIENLIKSYIENHYGRR